MSVHISTCVTAPSPTLPWFVTWVPLKVAVTPMCLFVSNDSVLLTLSGWKTVVPPPSPPCSATGCVSLDSSDGGFLLRDESRYGSESKVKAGPGLTETLL
jgi:hypothetical protein